MLSDYYYNTLSFQEQTAYNAIRSALVNSRPQCSVNGLNSGEAAVRVWKAVVFDHPEIIHYPGLFCRPEGSGNSFTYRFQYSETDGAVYEEKLNNLINSINCKMPPAASDYAACKLIYDTLASFVKYEANVLNEYLALEQENSSKSVAFMQTHSKSFTPYGVLMNGRGVCQGISKLFKILCERFGLQCACVEAKTANCGADAPNNHMLNVVEIDGGRAFVDVTNGLKSENLPVVRYDYFLMPERIISKSLHIDGNFGCNNENINYFVKNKLKFKSIDGLRKFLAAYTYRSSCGEVRCFYDGGKLGDDRLQDLFSYIINSHCREGYVMNYLSVKNGFCTGLIISDKES